MNKLYAASFIIVGTIVLQLSIVNITSSGETTTEPFSLRLTDSEGNDLSDPLFGDVTIFFDTCSTASGTIYKLKAMMTIKTIPANIQITASGGLFKLAANISGAESFLKDTGIRLTIHNSTDTFSADLEKTNNFSNEFHNGVNIATINPNIDYIVNVNLINEYNSTITPESIKDIRITFQAIASEGFHQVVFVSQDKTIESYMAFDNYIIEEVPSISRSGYEFKGWFTPDGREIANGYVISPDEGDILAIAEWEYVGNNTMLYVAAGGGLAGLAFLLLLILLKKKKEQEEPQ